MEPSTDDIAVALGPLLADHAAIHARLRELAGDSKRPVLSAQELRETLDRELGDISLTAELRKLRDEE